MKQDSINITKLDKDIIGLDLGCKRTGVARVSPMVKIAEPLSEIDMDGDFLSELQKIVESHGACAIVAGAPRGLDSQNTEQTTWAQQMISEIKSTIQVPVFTIDEAGTTKEAEVKAKQDQSVDSVAAGILLEDFLNEVSRGNIENVCL